MKQYAIRTGEVFTIGNDEFVICDLITHRWNTGGQCIESLPDPEVVFRRVANINAMKPVHEQIIMPLSIYKVIGKPKSLTERINETSPYHRKD